jgi:hypothetical protein
MSNLPAMMDRAVNPALLGWPPMLPYEIALREKPVRDICEAHGLDSVEWDRLRKDPLFIKALEAAVGDMRREGMGFKVKARLQAEALLTKSWDMIVSKDTADGIKADLIKSTMKWAGYEGDKLNGGGQIGTALQININLG